MKLGAPLDCAQWELRNPVLQNLASPPSSPVNGQFYFDTANKRPLFYGGGGISAGSGFGLIATDSDKLNGNAGSYYQSRANHTGTQLSITISDFTASVQANRLDQLAAPAASLSLNSQRLINLAAPTGNNDAATKAYVDSLVQTTAAGIDSKPSVIAVATSNITLSGTQTIDGVALVAGNRVLVTGQTDATTNGVYVVAGGAWPRATDADDNTELTPGAFWYVEQGTTYKRTQWLVANLANVTIGTSNIAINQFGAGGLYAAGNGLALTGQTFSINIKAGGGLVADGTGLYLDATVPRKYSASIGDGSTNPITVNHGLGTTDVTVMVKDASGNVVLPDITVTNANNVSIGFGAAPASNAYRLVVIG